MPGPRLALEAGRGPLGLDPGREARRVELLDARGEDQVDAGRGGAPLVGREVARIGVEVALLGELRGVHEHARDDDVALGPGGLEEGDVAGVQRAHGRDEAHRRSRPRRGSSACRSSAIVSNVFICRLQFRVRIPGNAKLAEPEPFRPTRSAAISTRCARRRPLVI